MLVLAHGEHNDGHRRSFANVAQRFKAVHFGHHHIQYYQVWKMLAQLLQRLDTVASLQDMIMFQSQIHAYKIADTRLIVYDEDGHIPRIENFLLHQKTTIGKYAFSSRGKLNENVDPWCKVLSTQMCPPCASTMARLI